MSIPKVFISYSHDSQQHKKWVLDFATRLRNTGVDASLDQWDLKPGDDLPQFMERYLASSDRVLMICTPRYVEKANAGTGGVGYEKMIVTADLLKTIDSNKVIPIVRQAGTHTLPTFLRTKFFLDFSRDDQFEFSFDELIRTLHNAPLFVKPPVGNKPFTPVKGTAKRRGDAMRVLMKVVAEEFDKRAPYTYVSYKEIVRLSGISRTMLDILIEDAKSQGLLQQDSDKDLILTIKGKLYVVEHKLVK